MDDRALSELEARIRILIEKVERLDRDVSRNGSSLSYVHDVLDHHGLTKEYNAHRFMREIGWAVVIAVAVVIVVAMIF